MYIPPHKLQNEMNLGVKSRSSIQLRSSHLSIHQKLVDKVFNNSPNVNIVYYSDRRTLMIAPSSDELFKSLHKAKQYMLKDRNDLGDKTIAIHDILIDNNISKEERELNYELLEGLNTISIQL